MFHPSIREQDHPARAREVDVPPADLHIGGGEIIGAGGGNPDYALVRKENGGKLRSCRWLLMRRDHHALVFRLEIKETG